MPQLIKPSDVKVLTKDGEIKVSITLDLNVNLQDLDLKNKKLDNKTENNKIDQQSIEDKTVWQIPDFSSEKINFGKEKT